MIGAMDVEKKGLFHSLLNDAGVTTRSFPFAGSVSPAILLNPKKSSKTALKDKAKLILSTLDLGMRIPNPKIPGISKLLVVSNPTLHIRGMEDDDGVKVATMIDGTIKLILPDETVTTEGSLTLTRGAGKVAGIQIKSTSKNGWSKAFGIPFLDLLGIGITGSIDTDAKGKRSVKLALSGAAMLGRQPVTAVTKLVIEKGALKDIGLHLPGMIDVKALPGLGQIPGINELAFSDMNLSLEALSGAVTWKRFGITSRVALAEVDGQYALFLRVQGPPLKLGRLAKNIPAPFDDIGLPQSALALSTRDMTDLTLGDLPEPVQVLFDGMLDGDAAKVPVLDGVNLVATLSEEEMPKQLRDAMERMGAKKMLDGNIVLTGTIGGLFKGLPNIALSGSLPGITIPKDGHKKQYLDDFISFNKGQGDFFIRADLSSTTFQLGLGGEMTVSVPRLNDPKTKDKLTVRGEVYANADLVSVAGSFKLGGNMDGKWTEPFGLRGFTIEDPAFVMGVDTEGSVEFGVGGDTTFVTSVNPRTKREEKLKFKSDFLININFSTTVPVPKKLALAFDASRVSIRNNIDIADSLFRGTLTGDLMAGAINAALTDENAKKALTKLQTELKTKSLMQIMGLDNLPIPYLVIRDYNFYFVTPGAVIPGRDKTLTGMGLALKGDFFFEFMGRKTKLLKVDNRLTLKDGLKIYSELPSFRVGPLTLNKAEIDILAKLDPAKLKYDAHFKIKGDTKFLGATEKLDLKLTKNEAAFFYDRDMGELLKVRIDAKSVGENLFKLKDFTVTAKATSGIDELASKVLPKIGIPKTLIDLVKNATPLLIDGLSFQASAADFIRGGEATMTLNHKFFGDRVRPATMKFAPVWTDPKSALPVTKIAEAMGASFARYLESNPKGLRILPGLSSAVGDVSRFLRWMAGNAQAKLNCEFAKLSSGIDVQARACRDPGYCNPLNKAYASLNSRWSPELKRCWGAGATIVRLQGSDFCLDAAKDNFSEGNEIILWKCESKENQSFRFTGKNGAAGLVRGYYGICLGAGNYGGGVKLTLINCSGAKGNRRRMDFKYLVDGRIQIIDYQATKRSDHCLALSGNRAEAGRNIIMKPCSWSDAKNWLLYDPHRKQVINPALTRIKAEARGQKEKLRQQAAAERKVRDARIAEAARKAKARERASRFNRAQLVNARGVCADDSSGKLTRGGKIIVWGCNGSGPGKERQLWSLSDRGQIVATNNLCLDVASPPAKVGTPMIIWGCNASGPGMERQRWRRASDALQHVQSGLCLSATQGGNQGGRLVLSKCTDTPEQKWRPRG